MKAVRTVLSFCVLSFPLCLLQVARADTPDSQLSQAAASARDFTLDFDQPAFYGVVELLRDTEVAPPPDLPIFTDWRAFSERPASLRGQWLRIRGRVGRNTTWTSIRSDGMRLGPFTQLELTAPDQPLACTLVTVSPADDVPIGAEVTADGVFVLTREYLSAGGRRLPAALLVSRGPLRVDSPAQRSVATRPGYGAVFWLAAVSAGLFVAWRLLRRKLDRAAPRSISGHGSQSRRPSSPPTEADVLPDHWPGSQP